MSTPSDEQLSRSLLQSLKDGTYPDSEDVVSADLPPSSLSKELDLIRQAREEVKNEIRHLSRENALDVDGWISQAKQLHSDIERSRAMARKIIQDHEHAKHHQANVKDAHAKVTLLRSEIVFNEALIETLDQVQDLEGRFGSVKECLAQDGFLQAISWLDEIRISLSGSGSLSRSKAIEILRNRESDVRHYIEKDLQRIWKTLIHIDPTERRVKIYQKTNLSDSTSMDLDTIASAFDHLGLLQDKIESLSNELDRAIISPLLTTNGHGYKHPTVVIDTSTIHVTSKMESGLESLFNIIVSIMKALSTMFPSAMAALLSQRLMPAVISKLTSSWLLRSLPVDIPGMEQFQTEVTSVLTFANTIESLDWPGSAGLISWHQDIPRAWLSKRRESALDAVRRLLSSPLQNTRQVERVEKQTVASKDDVFATQAEGDDWDAGWGNDDNADEPHASAVNDGDEEDVSAWGLDDDTAESKQEDDDGRLVTTGDSEEDDGGDAWGWGDDADGAEASSPVKPKTQSLKTEKNGFMPEPEASGREYVLRETYHISDIPGSLLELISTQIHDADTMSRNSRSALPISSAAGGLLSIPTVVLAMFRATAPSLYQYRTSCSNMYLYNDCMYMAQKLRADLESQNMQNGLPRLVPSSKLEPDIVALERFGKLAYGKEMEAQRQIIGDLLDGAQGFVHSSEYPFSNECETAVSSVVDWIRTLYRDWRDILSQSALFQSIGSLLSTAIGKIMLDIEDMNDISEPESNRLNAFCGQISKLEDLFVPPNPSDTTENEPPTPLTALYTPNWLKFQYLATILESSLADIKYLWTDGELSLELAPEEVTDLIKALFADSEHRRRAIGEIRRTSRG